MPDSLTTRLVRASGLPAVMRRMRRGWPLIVAYHGVCRDDRWRDWQTADMIAESVFRRHVDFFVRHYRVVSLRHIAEAVAGRRDDLPAGALAITFDDGYRNNATLARPILEEHGCTATFFCATGFLDGTTDLWWLRLKRAIVRAQRRGEAIALPGGEPARLEDDAAAGEAYRRACAAIKDCDMATRDAALDELTSPDDDPPFREVYAPMTWDDARDAVKAGFEIGAHTVNHPILSRESPETYRSEIERSIDRVRRETAQREIAFAYPNGQAGDFTPEIEAAVRDAGSYCAVAGFAGRNARADRLYALRRWPISGHHGVGALSVDLSGVRSCLVGLRRAVTGRT